MGGGRTRLSFVTAMLVVTKFPLQFHVAHSNRIRTIVTIARHASACQQPVTMVMMAATKLSS